MIESARGVILRVRPLTETSLIVNWLTPQWGRLATVAKGARRPKSPFFGKLDLFYVADFTFQRSRRSELHTLREVSLREPHAALRHELGWLRQAAYAAALIEQTTETECELGAVHELFTGLLDHLPKQPSRPRTVFAFELKLLHVLGLAPNVAEAKLTPAARQLVQALGALPWKELGSLQASGAEARAVQQFLHGFLLYHLGRLPKNRGAALGGDP